MTTPLKSYKLCKAAENLLELLQATQELFLLLFSCEGFDKGHSPAHYILVPDDDFRSFRQNGNVITTLPYGTHKDLPAFINKYLCSNDGVDVWKDIDSSRSAIAKKSGTAREYERVEIDPRISHDYKTHIKNVLSNSEGTERKILEILKSIVGDHDIDINVLNGILNFLEPKNFLSQDIIDLGLNIMAKNPKAIPDFGSFKDGVGTPKMIVLPSGKFLMGSLSKANAERPELELFIQSGGSDLILDGLTEESDEKPVQQVTVKKLAVSKFLVTLNEYQHFDPNFNIPKEAKLKLEKQIEYSYLTDDIPVIGLSSKEATEYCRWLSQKTGKNYRLLSEAEWEYACRAGSMTQYYWGNDFARPIPRFNNWQIADMVGVVYQWVQDHMTDYPDSKMRDSAAVVLGNASDYVRRVQRGGAYDDYNSKLDPPIRSFRSAYRAAEEPGESNRIDTGLRVACLIN